MTIHQLDPDEATKTVRSMLCSDCWGQLVARYDPNARMTNVFCSTEGCTCNGFVSRKGVEMREAKSGMELVEAKVALRNILPDALPKDEGELMKSLGF